MRLGCEAGRTNPSNAGSVLLLLRLRRGDLLQHGFGARDVGQSLGAPPPQHPQCSAVGEAEASLPIPRVGGVVRLDADDEDCGHRERREKENPGDNRNDRFPVPPPIAHAIPRAVLHGWLPPCPRNVFILNKLS